MNRTPAHRDAFLRLVRGELTASDLPRAALLVGAEVSPELDVEAYLRRLEALGQAFADHPRRAVGGLRAQVEALGDVLFEREGFRGNVDTYYDPRNSFLHEVLERRVGIPITLSLVFMAAGRAGGLDVEGVGLPGHFIVRVRDGGESLLVDPFHRGQVLGVDDCRRRVDTVYGRPQPWRDEWLAAVEPRDLLVRLLNNLKTIYLKATDFRQTLWVQDLLVALRPDDPQQYRDRGLVHAQLQRYADARKDLRDYLERSPGRPADADEIEHDLERLRRLHHLLN